MILVNGSGDDGFPNVGVFGELTFSCIIEDGDFRILLRNGDRIFGLGDCCLMALGSISDEDTGIAGEFDQCLFDREAGDVPISGGSAGNTEIFLIGDSEPSARNACKVAECTLGYCLGRPNVETFALKADCDDSGNHVL
jgi:hypothetical protein